MIVYILILDFTNFIKTLYMYFTSPKNIIKLITFKFKLFFNGKLLNLTCFQYKNSYYMTL
ncbi:hypothetical protein NC3_02900 [Bacillus altitudinis]|nr:hypothetical protein NC3_02900 [Bacillus altitudinis]